MQATRPFISYPIPLDALLGLNPEPHTLNKQDRFFFAYPLLTQRLELLKNVMGLSNKVIMVTGERGSGKTTLMHQYIANANTVWQSCRIRLKTRHRLSSKILSHLENRKIIATKGAGTPSVIIDDAHQLSSQEIKTLLRWAFPATRDRKLQSLLLFADAQMRKRYSKIADCLPPNAVIEKMHMATLTPKQTAAYLKHRIQVAGLSHNLAFSEDQVRTIQENSGGLPGRINHEAAMIIKRMEKRSPDRTTWQKWAKALSWEGKLLDKITSISKHQPSF